MQYRRVTTGPLQEDGLRVIAEGLKPDERVVVAGLQQVRPHDRIVPELIPMPSLGQPGGGRRDLGRHGCRAQPRRLPPSQNTRPEGDPAHDLALLHRPADLRRGAVDRHHADRRDRALVAADRAVSADHAAGRAGLDQLPGASAQVVADTVAAPIEQQVNGVEGMLYMSSQMGNDGSYSLTVTFDIGTDLNTALVMVQNRVALAMPHLPTAVQNQGITIRKKTPDILMIVNFFSPDGRYDDIYLSNYRHHLRPGRAAPRAGRLGHQLSGPARLQHPRLARPAEARVART